DILWKPGLVNDALKTPLLFRVEPTARIALMSKAKMADTRLTPDARHASKKGRAYGHSRFLRSIACQTHQVTDRVGVAGHRLSEVANVTGSLIVARFPRQDLD